MRKTSRYGWQPDLPDHRDVPFTPRTAVLPSKVDLRGPLMPEIYDQGQLGSCTANAIAGAVEFTQRKENLPDFMPSRLFIYYNERVIEGTVSQDSGAQIRDGIKSVAKVGVCPETEWPYKISRFKTKPKPLCYMDAKQHEAMIYLRVSNLLSSMKHCLAHGFPFVAGFTVYEGFESQEVADTGILEMPRNSEQVVGGHAILVVGYDDSRKRFLIRNSWGINWGQHGYFTMPYAYLMDSNLSDDFWTIRLVGART